MTPIEPPTEYHFVDPKLLGWHMKRPGLWVTRCGKEIDLPINHPVVHVPVGYSPWP